MYVREIVERDTSTREREVYRIRDREIVLCHRKNKMLREMKIYTKGNR